MEALGYWVSVEPFRGQRDIINGSFTSQRVCAHVLRIYPHQFDSRRNEEEIAMECLQQVHIDSVDVEVTEDLFEDGSRPPLEFEDPSLDFYGLRL